jgi:hypothetical protein
MYTDPGGSKILQRTSPGIVGDHSTRRPSFTSFPRFTPEATFTVHAISSVHTVTSVEAVDSISTVNTGWANEAHTNRPALLFWSVDHPEGSVDVELPRFSEGVVRPSEAAEDPDTTGATFSTDTVASVLAVSTVNTVLAILAITAVHSVDSVVAILPRWTGDFAVVGDECKPPGEGVEVQRHGYETR